MSKRGSLKVRRLLVVCTGNSCRSVMAKGLLKKRLQEKDRKDILVMSAGIIALPGFKPTQETIHVMAQHGIDVASHLTQRLTNEMVEDADLVLVMEQLHKQEILRRIPHAKKKVFLLREFADTAPESSENIDIADPIAKPMEVYESCFRLIQESVEKVIQKL